MKKADQKREENGLNEYGIIYLSGAINEGSAEQTCKQIIEHNIKGDVGQIQMIINSPGGSCASGFSIIDIMEWSRISYASMINRNLMCPMYVTRNEHQIAYLRKSLFI